MKQLHAAAPGAGSAAQSGPAEAKKVRRLSNRQFATLRSRMKGAQRRITNLKLQRDELKGIIRRRYLILVLKPENVENAEKAAVRRLSRAELKEYRARLADVKMLLEEAQTEHRQLKKQYEAEAQKRQDASTSQLQKQRVDRRASEKKEDLLENTVEQLKHAASNGGRAFIQGVQSKIVADNLEGAKADLKGFMEEKSPKLFNDVVASGIVYDRMVEKLIGEISGIELSVDSTTDKKGQTLTTLELSK